MTRLRRIASPAHAHLSPSWKAWRGLLYVVGGQLLARAGRLFFNPTVRKTAGAVVLLVGLVLQIVLVLVAGYLVDLSISLMDLWAELARKHLEITM